MDTHTTDVTLGRQVQDRLVGLGIETPVDFQVINERAQDGQSCEIHVCNATSHILEQLGLDLQDDSLKDTPQRVAKMYCQEIFTGLDYYNFPACTAIPNDMNYDEMLVVKATVKSMCEHHLMPIWGLATVGYIPSTKVLGLSKINRIVDFFSRRPQVQERLTAQISAALKFVLATEDVAVVINAEHFCVKFRGVEDNAGGTITSQLGGKFREDPVVRSEFLALSRS